MARTSTTRLTERERQILALMADGLSNNEIGKRLWYSPRTIQGHVATILHKLHVSNRTQAAVKAVRTGLIP